MRTKEQISTARVSLITHLINGGLSLEELAQYFNMTTKKMTDYLSKNSLTAHSLDRELTDSETLATSYAMQEQMWNLRMEQNWDNSEVLELLQAPSWVLTCEELV